MKQIRVFNEKVMGSGYSAYMPGDNDLTFGAIGEGSTPQEAEDVFLAVIEAMREDHQEVIEGLEFDFSFDFG